MSLRITCDWCAESIDAAEEYSAEELNRLGFEEGLESRYVILEARFSGCDRWGRDRPSREVRHFHNPGCYHAALRLLADQLSWSEAQNAGPRGAETPRWRLAERSPTPVPFRPAVDGTSPTVLRLDANTLAALWRAGIKSVGDLEALTEGELISMRGLGQKRVAEILDALARHNAERETEAVV